MRAPEPRKRYPLLGLAAYLLVPGDRRARAAGHFRRAGVEALKGFGALAIPTRKPGSQGPEPERIEIE
jgi:hypothetical protein